MKLDGQTEDAVMALTVNRPAVYIHLAIDEIERFRFTHDFLLPITIACTFMDDLGSGTCSKYKDKR